jgi:hypothetical protein
VKVNREGCFAKVGDLVRNGWCTTRRCIAPPYAYGVVVEVEPRSPEAYTPEHIRESPIRSMKMLSDGRIIKRYSVHIEVISEAG